jgi:1,2-diacylglycerol 3-beta-glucosyltransferase
MPPALILVLLVLAGIPFAAIALYLLFLSIAALFYSEPAGSRAPTTRLVVLVPAHDESAVISRCVRSLRQQSYPQDLYEIVVIADNCTDDTKGIAAAAGANCIMTRNAPDARGKGQALRWAMDQILTWQPVVRAVVVVDADSLAERDFIESLVRKFEAGADVVQGRYLLSSDDGDGETLGLLAFRLVNLVRQAGRAVLGLPVNLVGNGMLFDRRTLLETPWTAFTSTEDLEYGLMLHMTGARVRFAGDAAISAPPAPNARAAAKQKLRWQGGRAHLVRRWVPRLVMAALRARRPALAVCAFDLAVPPLAHLIAGIVAGTAITLALMLLGSASAWTLAPWLVALVSVVGAVVVGFRAAKAPMGSYRALLRAPLYVFRSLLRLPQVVTFRGDTWVRTERKAEAK